MQKRKNIDWLTVTLVLIVIILLAAWIVLKWNLETLYHWGGVLSGLFASAAFVAALYTIRIQKKAAEQQQANAQDQIVNAKKQLELAREELQLKDKQASIERFESTFFNLLKFHQDIVNNLKITYGEFEVIEGSTTLEEKISDGRESFEKVYNEVVIVSEDEEFLRKFPDIFQFAPFKIDDYYDQSYLDINRRDSEITVFKGVKSVLNMFGLEGFARCKQISGFDHYFRSLYRLIKFIDEADEKIIPPEEKYKYTALVRATLSQYELVLIYYNCLSNVGNVKFKPLVEDYSLLKNLREELLTYTFTPDDPNEEGRPDYERFMADKKGERGKYYIGAFYNPEELKKKKNGV